MVDYIGAIRIVREMSWRKSWGPDCLCGGHIPPGTDALDSGAIKMVQGADLITALPDELTAANAV